MNTAANTAPVDTLQAASADAPEAGGSHVALAGLSWPLQRLGEGLEALARHSAPRLLGASEEALQLPATVAAAELPELERWLGWAASRLGLEAEGVDCPVPQFASLLHEAGPAVLHLHHPTLGRRFVLLLKGRGATLRVLTASGRIHRVKPAAAEALRAAACAGFEAPLQPEIDRLLDTAAVPARRRAAVRRLLLDERLADQRVEGCWLLRLPATAPFGVQMKHAGLPGRLATILALFATLYALEIAGWQLIGDAALGGRLDLGWLTAWVLMLVSLLPLRSLSGWLDAGFALETGRLLKQRLLAGALRLNLDTVRHLGAGQLLGRVMESQALEGLALNGGLRLVVSTLELGFAAWVLFQGAAGGLHLALLGLWVLLNAGLSWRFSRALGRWTRQRLDLTNDLVERMVGHRTALAQEQPARRTAADDRSIQGYLHTSRQMDRAIAPIVAAAPGGWIALSLLGLGPAFIAGNASASGLAISLGGILMAHRALGGISGSLSALAQAGLAWQRVGELFRAGAQAPAAEPFVTYTQLQGRATPDATAGASTDATAGAASSGPPLVDASQLVFGYGSPAPTVLRGASLRIGHGERILLQGASGGGKSTLASLLVGLRQPDSGLLLLNGLDRHTLGDSWQALATEAPQFHENHVLTGTLAFNLLMGRNWPASEADLHTAKTLCEELGLGPLIARMPAGLQQQVGETGWQLSHGERSRLFLARALLQNAPLTILDESFAALDPATLQRCLQTALRRSRALVVIAHP